MKALIEIAGRLGNRLRPAGIARAKKDEALASFAAGDFAASRLAFEHYLASKPADFDSWIKLGACCSNLNDAAQAETCFRRAIELQPRNALGHVHLARALRADKRPLGALLRYRKVLALDPAFAFTAAEADLLWQDAQANATGETPAGRADEIAVHFDISDLLKFVRVNIGVSGIQRVQITVAASILRYFPARKVDFVFCSKRAGHVFVIPDDLIFDLLDEISHPDVSRAKLDRRLRAVRAEATPAVVRAADVFMLLGAFWIFRTYAETIAILRRRGVKVGIYVHDLIPLTHPHYFALPLRMSFRRQFAKVMKGVDFACTNSEFVANDLRRTLADMLQRSIPVAAVPPGQETSKPPADIDKDFAARTPREFVLCVCTLEVRKNHLLLLDVWNNLYVKYGDELPSLILVGKWGWKIKPLRARLQQSRYVQGKIVILGSLTEARLAYLYQNCLFTVFPSFVEGWGLPVGESLSFGKPCIASSTSSIPEVGGDLVRYIDPYDPAGATLVIEQALMDRPGLGEWTARIVREFRPRSWKMMTEDLLAKVVDCAACRRASAGTR